MKFNSDIDIDMADRELLLDKIQHVNATTTDNRKHGTGVYVTKVPYNPVNNRASLDYQVLERRGYFKLDLLNVNLYKEVKNEDHLLKLMSEPDWTCLDDQQFVEQLIHIGNHYQAIKSMPQPIDSIPRLAMFLAIIRPAKRHLIGLPWAEVALTIWDKTDDSYSFKRSHSIAYSHLVVVHMNLLREQLQHTLD